MFQFKQFAIRQDRTPMKVGTDGVLLGAWADLENAGTILDIGTGTGLIALMAAQRNPMARIDAIEIESNAFEQAQENVTASPWNGRIRVIQTSLQNYYPGITYDSIVCNPPFFVNSTKNPNQGRTLARHSDTLSHTELISHAMRLLTPDGSLCVILPTTEAIELIHIASQAKLYPFRMTRVLPNPDKAPKRYLIQFKTTQENSIEDELVVELSRHQYSEAYVEMTKAFYLFH